VAFDALVAAVTTGIEIALVIDGWPDWTVPALLLSAVVRRDPGPPPPGAGWRCSRRRWR
jgi:hypothetical protein